MSSRLLTLLLCLLLAYPLAPRDITVKYCVFQLKPITDSGASRSAIPSEADHFSVFAGMGFGR